MYRRYWHLPGFLQYYLNGICSKNTSAEKLRPLKVLLLQHLQERIGCTQDVPGAALRLIASNYLGMRND
jgi:hypothetical protein